MHRDLLPHREKFCPYSAVCQSWNRRKTKPPGRLNAKPAGIGG
ncbi:hypothetical protein B4135_1973 [Caldibacillus debilis]|uniref:Uncharacterized protein n=1 Tax=Caldibacillus debilis TaxID=301148 RepID=A0A150M6K7_9BACI|nr:hypothetical protein B4135_1973 [Caldibacillus debilis]